MIIKELDPFTAHSPMEKAGRAAEEQMAFYLRRAFQDEPDVYVFNDLRLEAGGDVAQMDHLILHLHGVIIVESKSVSTQVHINEHGEWTRHVGRDRHGIRSPIQQARLQGEFLRKYLQCHKEALRGRYLLGLKQGGFKHMPVGIVIAISDNGIIEPARHRPAEVRKADQVADAIREILAYYRRANSPLSLNPPADALYSFSKEEVARLVAFLPEHHKPSTARFASNAAALPAPEPLKQILHQPEGQTTPQRCPHCSNMVSVKYRYNYYLKCGTCGKNTPIRIHCPSCGEKARIRGSGRDFFVECATCHSSQPFHTNPL